MQVVLMSATLDATRFSSYLGGCPVIAAGGRTFPVQHYFLEDAYEMSGYLLDPDSPAAYRTRSDKHRQKQLQKQSVSQAHLGLVQVSSSLPQCSLSVAGCKLRRAVKGTVACDRLSPLPVTNEVQHQ